MTQAHTHSSTQPIEFAKIGTFLIKLPILIDVCIWVIIVVITTFLLLQNHNITTLCWCDKDFIKI